MICANKNNQRYYGIEHAGHKPKSGQPVRPYSTWLDHQGRKESNDVKFIAICCIILKLSACG